MKRTRLTPAVRTEAILAAAVRVAERVGFNKITRPSIAAEAECSGPLVGSYFGKMDGIRHHVMQYAIEHRILWLIAQGLALGDPTANKAPRALRDEAVAALSKTRRTVVASTA